jgi:hydroxymethylbilane synthase
VSSRAPLKLGTRGSDLARTQSTTVADALRAAGHDVELTIIKTAGDRDQTSQFGSIGAQGIFEREELRSSSGGSSSPYTRSRICRRHRPTCS